MHSFFEDYLVELQDAYTDFEKAINGLSVDALDWTPGTDMNSLAVLIVHTVGATRMLVGTMAAQIPFERDRDAEFRTKGLDEAALKAHLADSLVFVRGALETLTLDDLPLPRKRPGRDQTLSVAWALLHALEHVGLHTGHAQITRQLWDQRQ
jgi:hypothetical protein